MNNWQRNMASIFSDETKLAWINHQEAEANCFSAPSSLWRPLSLHFSVFRSWADTRVGSWQAGIGHLLWEFTPRFTGQFCQFWNWRLKSSIQWRTSKDFTSQAKVRMEWSYGNLYSVSLVIVCQVLLLPGMINGLSDSLSLGSDLLSFNWHLYSIS